MSTLSSWQPDGLTPAQIAAVPYLARYSGPTHALYANQLRRSFRWCETDGLDPLPGVQRAHVELYIRGLVEWALRDSSICTMMQGVRGFFRFAHGVSPGGIQQGERWSCVPREFGHPEGPHRL